MIASARRRSGGVTDPFFSSTKLLLSGNGTNGSQTFTDESAAAKGSQTGPGTSPNLPTLSSSRAIFGNGAIYFDGGDHLLWGDDADFDFGADDFTVEFFVNHDSVTGFINYIGKWNGSNNNRGWTIEYNGSGSLRFFISSNGTTSTLIASGSWTPVALTTYYICAERSGTTFRLYAGPMGGTASMLGSGTSSITLFDNVSSFRISGQGNGTELVTGAMDEIRITRGVARYATNSGFTVPTAAFPRS